MARMMVRKGNVLNNWVLRMLGLGALGCALAGAPSGCSKPSEPEKPAALPPPPPVTPPAATPPPAPAAAPMPAEAEAVPAAPDESASISGTITLPAAQKKAVSKGDTLFLIARQGGGVGPGMMLAVQKLTVDTFPMAFTMSSRDAMVPGSPFAGAINLSARVDKDGDPMTRKKGDVSGALVGVKVGSKNVVLPLNTVQKEDVTLGGGPGAGSPGGGPMMGPHGGGAMTPPHGAGLPAGHP